MTDLEDLWDDLPGRQGARSHDILRAGPQGTTTVRRGQRRVPGAPAADRRRAATGIVGAFLAGTLVGRPTAATGPTPPAPVTRRRGPATSPSRPTWSRRRPATSCSTPTSTAGWAGSPRGAGTTPYNRYWGDATSLVDGPRRSSSRWTANGLRETPPTAAPRTAPRPGEDHRQQNSDTGTNVQEIGVDEPDVVKTNGDLLLRLRDDELVVYDVTGEETERLSSVDLDGFEEGEIMLAGDQVVAVGIDDKAPRRGDGVRRAGPPGHPRAHRRRSPTRKARGGRGRGLRRAAAVRAPARRRRTAGAVERAARPRTSCTAARAAASARRWRRTASEVRELHHRGLAADASTADDEDPAQLLDCTNMAIPSRRAHPRHGERGRLRRRRRRPRSTRSGWPGRPTSPTSRSTTSTSPRARSWGNGFDCIGCIGTRTIPSVQGGSTYLFDFKVDGTRGHARRLRRGRGHRSPTGGRWTRPTACSASPSRRPPRPATSTRS